MKKMLTVLMAVLAVLFVSCQSSQSGDKDPAVAKGVNAWNRGNPESARAYWQEIEDSAKKKKYLNYITLFNAGNTALNSTDGVKASNEGKLLSSCNTALAKFSAIDSSLKLPANVCSKGTKLTIGCIDNLLAAGKIADANKMYKTAIKVYGKTKDYDVIAKEVDVCNTISAKRNTLLEQANKANEIENFESRIAAYDAVLDKCTSAEAEVNNLVKNSGVGTTKGVSTYARSFKNVRQNIAIKREGAFRDRVYEYKDRIGAEFARQPDGAGSGKNGAYTNTDILNHYNSVSANMDSIYNELLDFASKHNQDVGQDIIDDVAAQKKLLNSKIAQINREIAHEREVASRGKTVMPLMIGLFNPMPGSTAKNKKSRPAKFSATGAKKNEYWWGMVSIPRGQMNDLVITLKDNRTVRVFNENTKSGKLIEKNNLKDLVSRSSRVGNSWPVLNAGSQLKGTNYYFEVQKGKTENYSGEVVVYSSFITRMR